MMEYIPSGRLIQRSLRAEGWPLTVVREEHNTILLARAGSRSEWEDVCAVFPDATAFHRYDFLQSVAPSLHSQFMPLMVMFRNQVVGVAPLLVKRLGPFSTINYAPFPYLGPLVPPELIPATLSALRLKARRLRALNHQQSFARPIPADSANGFTSATDRTLVVPLDGRSDEDLLAAMSSSRRQQIFRALRRGFEIRAADAADFRLMEVWLRQVFAAQGLRPEYRPGTYERMFGALQNAPGSVLHAVRLDGRTVAVDVSLSNGPRAFGWQAAVDPSYRSKHPQVLLVWHRLKWARDAGAIEFDTVGAPNEGIATYKRGFGAVERHYTVLHTQSGPYLMASAALSHLRRSLLRNSAPSAPART
jgi:CelD/BcsL family acetyltransferase involved in cellulose biosynthesis